MSKMFESTQGNRTLVVDSYENGDVLLCIQGDGASKAFRMSPSTVPALDLAILEAAGYKEDEVDRSDDSYNTKWVMRHLRNLIEAQAKATAEAEEREELEAEALALLNAFCTSANGYEVTSFEGRSKTKPHWIAAARKARELAKEATK